MGEFRKNEIIKAFIAIFILIIAIFITFTIVYKYQVEGEVSVPFKLSKITVVSTVEGIENDGTEEKWNLNVYQNNDVYFSIEKSEENTNEIIQSVTIENIKVTKEPIKGNIVAYMPNSSDGRLFDNSDETLVDKSLTYKGASRSDSKTLEIGNQGGTAVIRFSNNELGTYISNEDEEIRHDASMLSKVGVLEDELNCEISFDLTIKLRDKSYTTRVTLELPCKGLYANGTSSTEITDGFIFKRAKK